MAPVRLMLARSIRHSIFAKPAVNNNAYSLAALLQCRHGRSGASGYTTTRQTLAAAIANSPPDPDNNKESKPAAKRTKSKTAANFSADLDLNELTAATIISDPIWHDGLKRDRDRLAGLGQLQMLILSNGYETAFQRLLKAADDPENEGVITSYFQLLLSKYADMRRWDLASPLLEEMEKRGIADNLQTKALTIGLYNNVIKNGNVKLKKSIPSPPSKESCVAAIDGAMKSAEAAGLNMEHVLLETNLTAEQIRHFVEGARRVKPSFAPALSKRSTISPRRKLPPVSAYEKEINHYRTMSVDDAVPTALLQQWEREVQISTTVDMIPTKTQLPQFAKITAELNDNKWKKNENKEGSVFSIWKPTLAGVIETDQLSAQRGEKKRGFMDKYWTFMYPTLTPDELADITLSEMEKVLYKNQFGIRLTQLVGSIGRRVYMNHFMKENVRRGVPQLYKHVYEEYEELISDPTNTKPSRVVMQELKERYAGQYPNLAYSGTQHIYQWPIRTMVQCGSVLVDFALQHCNVSAFQKDQTAPAFYHAYDFSGMKQIGFVRANELVHNGLEQSDKIDKRTFKLSFDASSLPMSVAPRPWTSCTDGNYLVTPVNLMRFGNDTFQHMSLLSNAEESLTDMFDAINYLSSCPWKINDKVLQVATEFYVDESAYKELKIPGVSVPAIAKPDDYDTNPESRFQFLQKQRQVRKFSQEMYGQRVDFQNKIAIAHHFKDDRFYLPHNVDFRGRAYVCPPHLTHMGGDLSRGLLKFADAKPLGRNGLRWLKIHLANVYGENKVSFDERERFADDHMDEILDSANDPCGQPLNGKEKWWRQSESPWQTLATCIEIRDAIQSGNPETFMCNLPVHQDGTCNGLQHYAALGGDVEGARAVNLTAADAHDRPQDVYSEVVKHVNLLVRQIADGTLDDDDLKKNKKLAKLILAKGEIPRKVVKQTVMTNVYGVTFVGARDQILKQLKSLEIVEKEDGHRAAVFLAKCVFRSLGELFESAQAIQKWLSVIAYRVCDFGDPVSWVTPLGLPVVQPYHTGKRKMVTTAMQVVSIKDTSCPSSRPDRKKQCGAFPPNFVHSLDSTHMMYTANACRERGVRFVAVHDSYWTHAADVDVMNQMTREQFVRLYSQPLLDNLYKFYKMQYDGQDLPTKGGKLEIPPPPVRGEFDMKEVLSSKYFFN